MKVGACSSPEDIPPPPAGSDCLLVSSPPSTLSSIFLFREPAEQVHFCSQSPCRAAQREGDPKISPVLLTQPPLLRGDSRTGHCLVVPLHSPSAHRWRVTGHLCVVTELAGSFPCGRAGVDSGPWSQRGSCAQGPLVCRQHPQMGGVRCFGLHEPTLQTRWSW